MRLIEDMRKIRDAIKATPYTETGTSAPIVHLASIDVESEGFILLEETVIRSHCVFK